MDMFNKIADKIHKYTGRLKPRVTPNMLRLPETNTSIPMPECKPPCTGSSIQCGHRWIYQESHYNYESGSYNTTYNKLDVYYCEKCLEKKEFLKSESSREKPLWWMH
jgi:hypothetical protein